MGFIIPKNIVLYKNISTNNMFLLLSCPYKTGDIILLNGISYEITVSNNTKHNLLFKKLKNYIPNKWHSVINFKLKVN